MQLPLSYPVLSSYSQAESFAWCRTGREGAQACRLKVIGYKAERLGACDVGHGQQATTYSCGPLVIDPASLLTMNTPHIICCFCSGNISSCVLGRGGSSIRGRRLRRSQSFRISMRWPAVDVLSLAGSPARAQIQLLGHVGIMGKEENYCLGLRRI